MPTGQPTKLKPCKICGELFLPEKPSSKICKKDHHANCPICGRDMIWNSTTAAPPCSKECRKEQTKQKNILKYGCEHPMQNKEVQTNHKNAMLQKYGVESPLQSTEIKERAVATNRERFGADWALSNDEIRTRIRRTMEDRYGAQTTLQSSELSEKVHQTVATRYGVDNVMQCEEIQSRVSDTVRRRFGVSNPMQSPEVAQRSSCTRSEKYGAHWTPEMLDKAKKSWMDSLGVDNPSKSPQVLDKITATFLKEYGVKRAIQVPEFREKMISTMIERYGAPYYCLTDEYLEHNQIRISKINLKFSEFLTQNGISHSMEFTVGSKAYDFKIDGTNILIEIDPTYTHNLIGNHWNRHGLSADYHQTKSDIAREHGYRCIHVFDWDDWDMIISMLKSKTAVYARNCKIYKLTPQATDEFLKAYHLQGTCRGQVLSLGLVQGKELLQVMTFGKSRYDKKYTTELLRLCTKTSVRVVGGASKLFQYATQQLELSNIVSYCDLAKFDGDVYESLGMSRVRTTAPQEIWSKGQAKVTANLLRQRGYDQLFGTTYGKGSNNEQLMLENGWLPVNDCGQAVYEYTR